MQTKCVLIKKELIDESLKQDALPGKRLLEPLKNFSKEGNVPFNILEDTQVLENEAEIHKHEADLWGCLSGEVTFIYGGELVDPWIKKNKDGTLDERELKAKEIKNGTKVVLKAGDWLWIPAGEPHQHFCKDTARLIIIKIPPR